MNTPAEAIIEMATALRKDYGDRALGIAELQLSEGGASIETWREIAAWLRANAPI
jgi:hypothetical protein